MPLGGTMTWFLGTDIIYKQSSTFFMQQAMSSKYPAIELNKASFLILFSLQDYDENFWYDERILKIEMNYLETDLIEKSIFYKDNNYNNP